MNKDEALLARKSKRLKSRYAAERRFRLYGASAVSVACAFLFFLLFSIFSSGYSAFFGTFIEASVHFDTEALGITASSSAEELEDANYMLLAKRSLYAVFSEVTNRSEKRELSKMLSAYAGDALREKVAGNPNILGTTQRILLRASSEIDQLHKGNISKELSAERRSVSDRQLLWYNRLQSDSKIVKKFDWNFLTSGDSRAPEEAGIGGAMVGTVFSLIVCLLLSFPLGVAAAVYLEEFAPKNRITDLIEVNINNLAAVPSFIRTSGPSGSAQCSGCAEKHPDRRWRGAGFDDPTGYYYCLPGIPQGSSSLDSTGSDGYGRFSDASGLASCSASGAARDTYGSYYWTFSSTGRDGSIVDDWDGSLYCGCAIELVRASNCATSSDLPLGREC